MFTAFNSGGFKFKKWATNSPELGRRMTELSQEWDIQVSYDQPDAKFLGVGWDQSTDKLKIPVDAAIESLSIGSPTKRSLLKGTAQIFDPLGFISPITIKAKILLQSLWKQKLKWDDTLTGDNSDKYAEFINTLKVSRDLRFDRNINTGAQAITQEMHTFADASGSGYGSVVYLREVSKNNNEVKIHFVASKAR